MKDEGADFSKVKLIPNNITDEPAALKANQTDAIWVFYGWGGINAEVEGVDCDYWNFKDIDSVFDYYTPVMIANNDFLKNSPDEAKAFLAATKKRITSTRLIIQKKSKQTFLSQEMTLVP